MKLLYLVITINLAFVVIGDPKVKHFYIENNKDKCALFDLSAEVSVTYLTNSGLNSVKLNMSQAQEDQHGLCNNGTIAVFNITIDPNLDAFINFNFMNSNQTVSLTSIQFGYTLSNNSYFPGAIESGYFSKTIYTNISLSKATNFYQCKSKLIITIPENVTLNIYFTKLKVFNVANSSFGDGMDECQEDFNNLTSTSTSSTLTSESKTTATISTLSSSAISTSHTSTAQTSTAQTSTAHTSTSHTSTSHTSTSDISTSHTSTSDISTSDISTSHTSKSSPTSSNPSTETSFITNSSSFSSTTHLTTMSTPISTTVNPQTRFLYAVRNNETTDVCLLIESIIFTSITYETTKHKNETKRFYFSNSAFTGHCSPNTDRITITSVPDVSLTLNFSKIGGSSELTLIQLNYTLSKQSFPDSVNPGKNIIVDDIVNACKVDALKGYKCKKVTFTDKSTVTVLESFQYEAFRNTKDLKFGRDQANCDLVPNSTVAIIVGIVLAVFLVIIVVVFLILRYRANKRKGYEEI